MVVLHGVSTSLLCGCANDAICGAQDKLNTALNRRGEYEEEGGVLWAHRRAGALASPKVFNAALYFATIAAIRTDPVMRAHIGLGSQLRQPYRALNAAMGPDCPEDQDLFIRSQRLWGAPRGCLGGPTTPRVGASEQDPDSDPDRLMRYVASG